MPGKKKRTKTPPKQSGAKVKAEAKKKSKKQATGKGGKPRKPKKAKLPNKAKQPRKGKGARLLKPPPVGTVFLGYQCSCGWRGVFVNDPPDTPCPRCANRLARSTEEDGWSREEEIQLCKAAWAAKQEEDAAKLAARARAEVEAQLARKAAAKRERHERAEQLRREQAALAAQRKKEKAARHAETLAQAKRRKVENEARRKAEQEQQGRYGVENAGPEPSERQRKAERRRRRKAIRARVAEIVRQSTARWAASVKEELQAHTHDVLLERVDAACKQPVVGRCLACTSKAHKTAQANLSSALRPLFGADQDRKIRIDDFPAASSADRRYGVLSMALALAKAGDFYSCPRCDPSPQTRTYDPRPPLELRGGVWVVKWV